MLNRRIVLAAALGSVLPTSPFVLGQGREIGVDTEIRLASGIGGDSSGDPLSTIRFAWNAPTIGDLTRLPLSNGYFGANLFAKSISPPASMAAVGIPAPNLGFDNGLRQLSAPIVLGSANKYGAAAIPVVTVQASIRPAFGSIASPVRPSMMAMGGPAPPGKGVETPPGTGGGFVPFDTVPEYSSRPGAAYTLYLNFNGFSFTGTWGGTGKSPGVVPAYATDSDPSTFTTTELANIKNVWSRVAEKYIAFNVNVTTVDPAVAAGQAGSDFARQAYYDSTARLMHTVIGGVDDWYGSAGGVSYGGVAKNTYSTTPNGGASAGYHTNWVFPNSLTAGLQYLAEAGAHEDGHALGLSHQSRWTGSPLALTSTYDTGSGTGANSFAPIMGNSYSAQRGTWRVGATNSNSSTTAQNDIVNLLANPGIRTAAASGFIDSGIGHTRATATGLPMTGNSISTTAAAGHIAPSVSPANPIGESNYTTDFFSFTAASQVAVAVSLRSGRQSITVGSADPGATLNATLRLLDATGSVLITANSGALVETITTGLPAGNYYFQISSAGGQTNNGYTYYDMGSYFLSGTITPVPEPAEMMLIAAAGVLVVHIRRTRLRNVSA